MINRKDALHQIRPKLDIDSSLSSDIESFQNAVLRPILKFQNEIIVAVCENWLSAHKQDLSQIKREKAMELLAHVLKTNKALKAELFGLAIGMMDLSEYGFYLKNKRECSKRISSMLIQRLQDQLLR